VVHVTVPVFTVLHMTFIRMILQVPRTGKKTYSTKNTAIKLAMVNNYLPSRKQNFILY